jgi:anti-sigma factor RsiW
MSRRPIAIPSSPGLPANSPLRRTSWTFPPKASHGARIDVIGLQPVASLVYSKGKHLITVMEMPNPRGLTTQLTQHVEQGYQTLTWSDGNVTYWVVSDAVAEELKTFVGLFQAAAS